MHFKNRKERGSYMTKNYEKTERKLLSPKLDVVFQALFGEEGNENITKDFLESVLKKKITEIDLSKNVMLRRNGEKDKLGILDVAVKINNNENCDIEIQMTNEKDIVERILFYWSKMYIKSINKGEEYSKLEKAIVILISNNNIKQLKEIEKYHAEWKIIETESKKVILTNKLEIHIIELSKIKEEEAIRNKDRLLDWLMFLNNPESEEVEIKMEENKNLKEAKEKLNKISEDEKMQQLAWWRQKAIYEENTRINGAIREGKEEGREEGRKEGIIEGEKKMQIEIAKKLLRENLSLDIIERSTGLRKEEIENLK